jgi:hypothetical protein
MPENFLEQKPQSILPQMQQPILQQARPQTQQPPQALPPL